MVVGGELRPRHPSFLDESHRDGPWQLTLAGELLEAAGQEPTFCHGFIRTHQPVAKKLLVALQMVLGVVEDINSIALPSWET